MSRGFAGLREARVGTHYREVATPRRSKRNFASCKIRVSEQMRSEIARLVANPPYLPMMFRRGDVTYQAVKLAIAFGRPFGDETGKVTNRPKQIKSGHSGSAENLHQHLGSQGLKYSTICLVSDLGRRVMQKFNRFAVDSSANTGGTIGGRLICFDFLLAVPLCRP